VSSQCFGERPDGGQTDDVTYGHAPAGGVTLRPLDENGVI
jgi:hypothetical protein